MFSLLGSFHLAVVIKNMPDGGSTKGANFFAKRASYVLEKYQNTVKKY